MLKVGLSDTEGQCEKVNVKNDNVGVEYITRWVCWWPSNFQMLYTVAVKPNEDQVQWLVVSSSTEKQSDKDEREVGQQLPGLCFLTHIRPLMVINTEVSHA